MEFTVQPTCKKVKELCLVLQVDNVIYILYLDLYVVSKKNIEFHLAYLLKKSEILVKIIGLLSLKSTEISRESTRHPIY